MKAKVIFYTAIVLSAYSSPAHADEQMLSAQAALPIKYIGNAESHKFHRPSCPFARTMALNKRVQFYFRSQAVASGHIPCRYCLPPIWTVLRGRILSPLRIAPPVDPKPTGDTVVPHPP